MSIVLENKGTFNDDLVDDESMLLVTSSMTGREFTIRRSVSSTLAGDYISCADVDPTLSDMPVLLKLVSKSYITDESLHI